MTDEQTRKSLVEAGLRLAHEGLVARSWGNVSLRVDTDTMAITPSGIPWDKLTPDMISLVDLETGDWKGDWKPSGERKVHRAIYLRRPEVGAVVHTHQPAASVWAAARLPVAVSGRTIGCAPYALPGTKALTQGAVRSLDDASGVLLANHGAVTVGSNLDQAFEACTNLEKDCADLVAVEGAGYLPGRIDLPWRSDWLEPGPQPGTVWSRAPFTVAWSKTGRNLPAVLDDLAQLVGSKLRTAKRERILQGSLMNALVPGEGAILMGTDAEALAMVVEKAARAVLGGQVLRSIHRIPAWEAHLMRFVYAQSYSKQASKTR